MSAEWRNAFPCKPSETVGFP